MDGGSELRQEPPKVVESGVERLDRDDTDCELRHILLIAQPLIGGHENVERRCGLTKKVAILQTCPAFLLNCSDRELRQVTPKLPRHVLVEKNPSHAI